MNKILFSHSYFLRFDPKQWANSQPYAPLGTLYAAAVMRARDYKVSLFDTMFAESPEALIVPLDQQKPAFFVVYDDGFNYLTKMCLTNMREAAFRMIALAKERNCTVIVSSSDATDHFENYLAAGADFIMIGEAEQTLVELVKAIESGEDFSMVKGLAFKKDNVIVRTQKRNVIKDLDNLPLPAWDLIDIQPYKEAWKKHVGYFSMNIGTTRGCPYKCNWCAKPIYGNRYNARSPQNVVKELKWLKELYHFDHIWFCDDIFGLKPGWVNEFAGLVAKEGLQFRFKIQSRADLLVQDDYVKALAKAGCDAVWMGAESGSQKVLDAMDKGTTIQQIERATTLLKQHGVKPCFFIQFGYLGETKKDIELTIALINKLLPHEIGISVSYPLPGTLFYEKVKHQLKEKANWTDSDEMALMFRNTFEPAFYKQLHKYVHKSYRKHKAYETVRCWIKKPLCGRLVTLKKLLSLLYYIPSAYLAKMKLTRLENA